MFWFNICVAIFIILGINKSTFGQNFEDDIHENELQQFLDGVKINGSDPLKKIAQSVQLFLYRRSNEVILSRSLSISTGVQNESNGKIELKSRVIPPEDFDNEFDVNLETKIIIHGWMNSKDTQTFQNIKDKYLELQDYNVFVVDWSKFSYNLNYIKTSGLTVYVGQFLAELIDKLVEKGAQLDKMHLIGHSLGAHIAGFIGSKIKSGKIRRITGLDPALPNFDRDPEKRLDPTDAQFVDVIHTGAGVIGIYTPIGHADFYPNGGTPAQPGCKGPKELINTCSHGRAIEYFYESITSQVGFWGVECDSWSAYKKRECSSEYVLMGDGANNTSRGMYFLGTNDKEPFAMGQRHFFKEDSFFRGVFNSVVHGVNSFVSPPAPFAPAASK